MNEILNALRQAQALGLPASLLQTLCAACGVEYGAILPPISGKFAAELNQAGV